MYTAWAGHVKRFGRKLGVCVVGETNRPGIPLHVGQTPTETPLPSAPHWAGRGPTRLRWTYDAKVAKASEVPSLRPPRSRAAFLALAGVIATGLVVAIVFIAVGERGEPVEIVGVGETNEVLGGIRQEGAAIGSPAAPVTVSIFNDLQCPECAAYQLEVVPPLVRDLVRPGEARLEFRHFSLGRQQPTTVAAIASAAAGEQSHQWQFVNLFYLNIEEAGATVSEEFLRAVAGAAGLDIDEWEQAREGGQAIAEVERDAALARELRLPANPSAVVDGPAGTRRLTDEPTSEEIAAAVEAAR